MGGFSIKDSLTGQRELFLVGGKVRGGTVCAKHGLYGLYNLFGDCPHGDTWSFSSVTIRVSIG